MPPGELSDPGTILSEGGEEARHLVMVAQSVLMEYDVGKLGTRRNTRVLAHAGLHAQFFSL